MEYKSLKELCKLSSDKKKLIWQIVLEDDAKERSVSKEEVWATMETMYDAMKQADRDYDGSLRSPSGMAGGDGAKFEEHRRQEKSLFGPFLCDVVEKSLKMGESNACMKRIVAAPTAGSCGVMPAVFLAYEKLKAVEKNRMIEALFVSAGVGAVIAENASISGAEGGCQAEIGSAAAMSAAGLAYLEGGDNETIMHAAALTLKNMLGLTCDPVAGLVEVPCIKRNVFGAVNAITGSQLALAGIRSVVEPDEVVETMGRIGAQLPACLRETSEGGLAITETGLKVKEQMEK